eukprot:1139977-Pelagomonas_calceolata.AAC.3
MTTLFIFKGLPEGGGGLLGVRFWRAGERESGCVGAWPTTLQIPISSTLLGDSSLAQPFLRQQLSIQAVSGFLLQHFKKLFFFMPELLDLLLSITPLGYSDRGVTGGEAVQRRRRRIYAHRRMADSNPPDLH